MKEYKIVDSLGNINKHANRGWVVKNAWPTLLGVKALMEKEASPVTKKYEL